MKRADLPVEAERAQPTLEEVVAIVTAILSARKRLGPCLSADEPTPSFRHNSPSLSR